MANILITGGAGFMGRWVSKHFVEKGHSVWVLDNLSNGSAGNIEEFKDKLASIVLGDIKDRSVISSLFEKKIEICIHLAAAINVQESINNPEKFFQNNVIGTFNILEECRKFNTKIVFVSSALVYETTRPKQRITEKHPVYPSCPYTASKIFGEQFTISYFKTYNLPVVILRPFSVYGPWQRSDSEGGVMSIFIERKYKNKPLEIFGDGRQGRDFFYIEDCAEFIEKAAFSEKAVGEVLNAGSGVETKIKDLARIIADGSVEIKMVSHPHLYAEIMNMCADSRKAERILSWKAKTTLKEGIKKTEEWLKSRKKTV